MLSTIEKTTFVFIVGDRTYSGNGYVNSISMRRDSPVEMLSFGDIRSHYIQTSPFFDLDVSIRASDIVVSEGEWISKKLVNDCSIEELIFAITQKVNEKK